MDTSQLIENQVNALLSSNELYSTYRERWNELYQAYIGGEDYTLSGHLQKYQLENNTEYSKRLNHTPLENHCRSCISVYNGFLFRYPPFRDLGTMIGNPVVEEFLQDADQDGQSLNEMMRNCSTFSSVFGAVWLILTKPNLGLQTQAEELSAGVRPYLNMLTPLAVTDWQYTRNAIGKYTLSYFKYIEDFNGDIQVIKEWTPDTITTSTVNVKEKGLIQREEEINQLGEIPAICVYNQKSDVRGIGISDIQDIALMQKHIFNMTSEAVEAIKMGTHPSVVATQDIAGLTAGPGSVIQMPDNLEPGLKPYALEFSGAPIDSIYKSINHAIDSIDKMANTGAVRATEAKTMSGVAMEVEFSLLNSRLAQKGQGLQLAEEQMWKLFAKYIGTDYTGYVQYPNSFNIRDKDREIAQLKTAKETATDANLIKEIDKAIYEWMGYEKEEIEKMMSDAFVPHIMKNPETGEEKIAQSEQEHLALQSQGFIHP